MDLLQKWELASYIVTVFGFPAAISVFFIEQARERETEEEEIYQRLQMSMLTSLRFYLKTLIYS